MRVQLPLNAHMDFFHMKIVDTSLVIRCVWLSFSEELFVYLTRSYALPCPEFLLVEQYLHPHCSASFMNSRLILIVCLDN